VLAFSPGARGEPPYLETRGGVCVGDSLVALEGVALHLPDDDDATPEGGDAAPPSASARRPAAGGRAALAGGRGAPAAAASVAHVAARIAATPPPRRLTFRARDDADGPRRAAAARVGAVAASEAAAEAAAEAARLDALRQSSGASRRGAAARSRGRRAAPDEPRGDEAEGGDEEEYEPWRGTLEVFSGITGEPALSLDAVGALFGGAAPCEPKPLALVPPLGAAAASAGARGGGAAARRRGDANRNNNVAAAGGAAGLVALLGTGCEKLDGAFRDAFVVAARGGCSFGEKARAESSYPTSPRPMHCSKKM